MISWESFVGSCADGEVLIRFCLMVLTRQLKLLNIMTLLVMPPAIYAPLICRRTIKDEVAIEQLIRI